MADPDIAAPQAGAWTVLLLAGQRPGIDPLAAHFGATYKALLPVAGTPMLTRVLQALHASPDVGRIVVLAQEAEPLTAAITAGGGADFFASNQGISTSILAFLSAESPAPYPVLITTADHPLLTPAMVADFVAAADGDLSVGMVARTTMLARFPDAERTWIRMADDGWSGTNLFALRSDRVHAALTLWAAAEQDRKRVARLFWRFGPWLALRALTRSLTMADALRRAGARLGLDARLVPMADPVAAIDVDKPADHAQAEAILARRGQYCGQNPHHHGDEAGH